MKYLIKAPANIAGSIKLPASKSIANRILIINALAQSSYSIENLSESDDTQVLYKALNSKDTTFDIGPAGTAMRFMTAYLSKLHGEWIITGSERMKNRPIKLLVDALEQLGAKIEYVEKEGYPPLRIFGQELSGKTIELDGGISSQYISALLMVAPTISEGLTLELKNKVISKPYIALTLGLMKQFGVDAIWNDNTIVINQQNYKAVPFKVESDWSAASYWYQMVALTKNSRIELPLLYSNSLQGDSKIAGLFEKLGVTTTFVEDRIVIENNGKTVSRFDYDFINQPDMAQTFAVTCCLMDIPFRFDGLQSLKIKETNRIVALQNELKKVGYILIEPEEGSLAWEQETTTKQTAFEFDSYEDHRMAMAFAPIALKESSVIIDDPKVVSKSYPRYWEDLMAVGFEITEL